MEETQIQTLFQSVSTLPVFLTMFILIYLIGYFIVFRHWSPKQRPEASSCFISLFHGTPAVFLAAYAILSDGRRGFASPNTETQNRVIDYSVAYFLTDLLHYFVFFPSDVLFIGHHLATLFAFLTCKYVAAHGAFAICVLLAMAEVTSFCQNMWTLAGVRKGDDLLAKKVYDFLSPPFYTFYSIVRGFAAPFFAYKMGASYISGIVDGVIPKWVWISWMFLVVTFIPVSLLWVSNLWVLLYKERKLEKFKTS
ncbi:TLC domain-containing protein At5g14285-like [Malania oleifera]|uniref:TLC domain-containing protein At5g14285-like n=1 Tax=Malania oleifera TaxID=397392 RepID=UPI0025AE63CB|nr:TLC domain-containing protein At5g14285-like [Malania oleifera]